MTIEQQIQQRVRENLKYKCEPAEDYYQRTWLKANREGIAKFIKNKGHENS